MTKYAIGNSGASLKGIFVIGSNFCNVALPIFEEQTKSSSQYVAIKRHIEELSTHQESKPRTDTTTFLYRSKLRHVSLPDVKSFLSR